MEYNYNDIIKGLNEGRIKSIFFSIRNYTHYKNCMIRKCIDIVSNKKQIIRIEVKLTKDDSEIISFYNSFKEDYKLFKLGRGRTLTLKQIWNDVQISYIDYNTIS